MRTSPCLLALALAAACSETPPAVTPDAAPADVAPTDVALDVAPDAPADVASDLAPSMDAPADVSPDAPLDVAADASPDASPDAAPPPCPTYQARCGGACIPVANDPANCGGCDVRCAAGQVCSGGACGATCLTGLTACAGRCVDVQSDSAHCGACGAACPAGQGCVAGACRRLMILDPSAVPCAGGVGPLVDLGGGRCAGAVAETTFRWALCSCNAVSLSGPLTTDGFDSTRGPYTPGGLGAGVGANGPFSSSAPTEVGGALWLGNAGPWGVGSAHNVRQVLRVNGDINGSGPLTAGDEAFVNGSIRTSSRVAVTGALHLPDGAMLVGDVTAARLARGPVTVEPPCDCSAATRVPLASFLAEARTRNDNARLGLDAGALINIDAPARLDLPCGRYLLRGVASSAPVAIVAHGRTALFIDGDISMSERLTITVDPGGELDVVIAGRVGVSAPITFGSPAWPALTRVYVASTDGLSLSSGTVVGANLYLPEGRLGTSGSVEVFGALFVGELSASERVTVHYDRAVLRVGDPCHPETTPAPDAGVAPDASAPDAGAPDAGRPDGGCATCRDCANQACNGGTCGPCRVDGDCCAPLQCWMGRCVVIPG